MTQACALSTLFLEKVLLKSVSVVFSVINFKSFIDFFFWYKVERALEDGKSVTIRLLCSIALLVSKTNKQTNIGLSQHIK